MQLPLGERIADPSSWSATRQSNSLRCNNWCRSFINGRTGNDIAKRVSSLFVIAVHFIPLLKWSRSASSVGGVTKRNYRRQAYPFSIGRTRDQERDIILGHELYMEVFWITLKTFVEPSLS